MSEKKIDIVRQAVKSRDIAIIGYDAKTATLEVTFREGGVYQYSDVPPEVHQALLQAPSCGTYFNDNVKGKYSYRRMQ